ncbi:MAG: TRAP transporter substrate-binding protein [Desulfomonile tiedjei]|uniref:TRAP transporter substrate-binding protein n=1 Tax=Desulfomonile tiedjei TaxID=2358 RepID=A0A9D6UXI3_9BACT|nr:TRAP transporter substrate-binding protein [Desulfomonile tiedjei]
MFRKKNVGLLSWGSTFLILVVAVCAARADTVTLNYSLPWPATHGNTLVAAEWAKEVEKRTNGAVKIHTFPSGTLTPLDQTYDGVVKGICDIGLSVVSYVKGRFPLSEVIDLPLGYTSGLQATRLANAYFAKFKPKEFDDVKMLYMHAHGPGVLITKKPVNKLEDLKGMKIRCTGTSLRVVSALGGVPVAMPQTETYDAVQKGVVDGLLSPIETLQGWKFAEVAKYTTENFSTTYTLLFFTAMNKKKWDSLPKDVQETIEKINAEWIEKSGKAWEQIDKSGKEFALSKGVTFIALSKEEEERWAKAVQPVLQDYVKMTESKGLPGGEALIFCQEWLKKNP